jgi:hypothetical protein
MDASELSRLDDLITPLVLKGQSLYHIWTNHRYEIGLCLSTLYTYVGYGLFTVKRLHLPRAVRFKPRKEGRDIKPRADKSGRTYDDYLVYLIGDDHGR